MFFKRPQSQTFSHYRNDQDRKKSVIHTSLYQSSMLDYPCEFSLTGFAVLLNASISPEDRAEIVENGTFQFLFSGRHPYLTTPLAMFPSALRNIDEIVEACELPKKRAVVIPNRKLACLQNDPGAQFFGGGGDGLDMSVHHRSKWVVPFEIPGRQPLQIKPGEAFNVKIEFERKLKLSKPARIMVVLDGYSWKPI